MIRSSVDLPPPDGPSSAVSCPDGMDSETSSRATKLPKRFLTWLISMLIGRASGWVGSSRFLRSPGTAQGRDQQGGDGNEGEQERRGIGAALVEIQILVLDAECGGPGLAVDVAGDHLHRAELTQRTGQAQHDA